MGDPTTARCGIVVGSDALTSASTLALPTVLNFKL
jgi:hypothetical protein